jgi:DNA-binding CsgD family transcriptional regulator
MRAVSRVRIRSRRDVDEYFAARFAEHRFPPASLQLFWARTAGNPLFLVRVVDSWLKRGLLNRDKGQWELGAGLEEVARSHRSVGSHRARHSTCSLGYRNDKEAVEATTGSPQLRLVELSDADFPLAGGQRLSASERLVLDALLKGASNARIAHERGRVLRTVSKQVRSLYRKLGVTSRAELAARLASGHR